MAQEINLTDGVIRVLAAGTTQLIQQAVDVGKYDQLDLMLVLIGFEGSTPSGFAPVIISGMQRETENGWPPLGSAFGALTAANTISVLNVPKLFRYARWSVPAFTGATAVSFMIRGMARNN